MAEVQISGYTVFLDDDDLDKFKDYNWYVRKPVVEGSNILYVYGDRIVDKKRSRVAMHRYIMGCIRGDKTTVDHINHNTLDNRKSNLRVCTHQENNYNSQGHRDSHSKHKGIRKHGSKWEVRLSVNKEHKFIGLTKTLDNAIRLHDLASILYHGEYAYTENPREEYVSILDIEEEIKHLIDRDYTSKYRGVTHIVNNGDYYRAAIWAHKKYTHIGCFKSDKEAALAYNEYAIKLHGNKAKLNEVSDV